MFKYAYKVLIAGLYTTSHVTTCVCVCVCVCSFGTSQGIRLASAAHEAEEVSIHSMTLLGTALTLPAGGPFLFKLPVFVLDWIQPWLTAKFATIAFHDDCPPEIITKSSEQSSSNPMHVCQAFYRQFKW
jgi:hypothetical protein